jgi:hypothetical protein
MAGVCSGPDGSERENFNLRNMLARATFISIMAYFGAVQLIKKEKEIRIERNSNLPPEASCLKTHRCNCGRQR